MALSPDCLQHVADPVAELWEQVETEILKEIVWRIRDCGMETTATAEYLALRLEQLGLFQDALYRKLAKLMNISDDMVRGIIEDAAYNATADDMLVYKAAGMLKEGVLYSLTPRVFQQIDFTCQQIQNLTQTTASNATTTMLKAMDKAYLQVSSGLYSLDKAVAQACQDLANDGIEHFTYPSGVNRTMQAAVTACVRTGANQCAMAGQEWLMDQLDVNLVETSSHMGARPSHALWQGKVFWRKYPEGNYQNFAEATGYGTVTGLGGVNCRHSFYPYFPGTEKTYRPQPMKENKEVYELTQQQRYYERQLRKWKRRMELEKAGGLDATAAKLKVKEWGGKIKALVAEHPDMLKPQYSQQRVYLAQGIKRVDGGLTYQQG